MMYGVFTVNFEHISLFFSSAFIVDVEQVNVYWAVEILYEILITFKGGITLRYTSNLGN